MRKQCARCVTICYHPVHNQGHKWFFYPGMTIDEAILIKQWDSFGGLAISNGNASLESIDSEISTFSFHSAFNDAQAPKYAPDRWSIEVRCMVLFG